MIKEKKGTIVDNVGLAQRLGAMEEKSFLPPREEPVPSIEVTQQEIVEAFQKFIDRKLPDTSHLEFRGDEMVVEVFTYTKPYTGIIDTGGRKYSRTVSFSIAKVIANGPEATYKVGEIVKLKDYDTAVIPNPAYEAWSNNPYSKSNAERVGVEPPRYLDNLQTAYAQRVFRINPLKLEMSESDKATFKLNNPHIECRVANVSALLG